MSSIDQSIAEDLAASLRSTTTLMNSLLLEIRDNATSVAVLKEKIDTLNETVSSLSHIIRNDNGKKSMITRLALAEDAVQDIEMEIKDIRVLVSDVRKEIKSDKEVKIEFDKNALKFNAQKFISIMKIVAASVPGLIALIIILVRFFFKLPPQ